MNLYFLEPPINDSTNLFLVTTENPSGAAIGAAEVG
jgi:hypothetical protein